MPFQILQKKGKEKTNERQNDWKYLALHDEMTHLYNKRGYEEILKTIIPPVYIIYFDINSLKQTNDILGHEKGNILIKTCAKMIGDSFPDNACRTGGDEFIIFDKISKSDDEIQEKILQIKSYLDYYTENDNQGIIYSIASGYAFCDDADEISLTIEEAEKRMYEDKQKIKAGDNNQETPDSLEEYNELLTNEQQQLKERIAENHEEVAEETIENAICAIKEKDEDIEAIFITNKTFDYLFIFTDTSLFYQMTDKMNYNMDFSYLYVLYRGGPRYYGVDEYTSEITHLFEDIGRALQSRQIRTSEDLAKINGINIFKEIHADFL